MIRRFSRFNNNRYSSRHRAWTDPEGDEYNQYGFPVNNDSYFPKESNDSEQIAFDLLVARQNDDEQGIAYGGEYDDLLKSLDLTRDEITEIFNELLYFRDKHPEFSSRLIKSVLADFEVGGAADYIRRNKRF